MRQIILMFLFIFIWTSKLTGQTQEKGIYRGQATSLFICYFTHNDSIIEVEYFNQKAGQTFGHVPAKKLIYNTESYRSKPIFKSADDSVFVFLKKNYYLVKNKGFGNMKVYKSADSKTTIDSLREQNILFRQQHSR